MEETLHEEEIGKIEKEYYSNQNCNCTKLLLIYMKKTSSDSKFSQIITSYLCLIVT